MPAIVHHVGERVQGPTRVASMSGGVGPGLGVWVKHVLLTLQEFYFFLEAFSVFVD